MSGEKVPLGRKVGVAQAVEPGLVGLGESQGEDQRRRVAAQVGRWLDLTRVVLPGLAESARWPIRLDHCFMRVLLDHAVGGVWHRAVRRPAIRHLSPAQLDRAIALAERVIEEPALLPALNRQSLAWRREDRLKSPS